MTNKECISGLEVLKQIPHAKNFVEHIDFAIKVLEQTDGDYISRTELLARIDAERKYLLDLKMDGAEHIVVHHARRIIEDMPPVTPQSYKENIE